MSCNAYTNQASPQIIFGGTLANDFCHVDWQTTFETFRDSLTGALPGTVSSFIVSDAEPGVNDRDKAWLKVSATCVPVGWYLYSGGAWVEVGISVMYGEDSSTLANIITVVETDPFTNVLQTGHIFLVEVANSNTGAVVATINSPMVVSLPVKKYGNTALTGYEMLAGMVAILTYDGTNLQLLNPRPDAIAAKEDGLFNGSFEIDFDTDGVPDRWTRTLLTTGVGTIDETDSVHGKNSFKFATNGGAGNGGGSLETVNFYECDGDEQIYLTWWMKSTATIDNLVEILWFDEAMVALAVPNDATTLYSESTNNPTAWSKMIGLGVAPAAAHYFKVKITGGVLNSAVGTVRFDDFRVEEPVFQRASVFSVAGSLYSWKAPPGPGGTTSVYAARVTAVGGGAGGWNISLDCGGGGGGGSLAKSLIYVTPGTVYGVVVGAGGKGETGSPAASGSNSSFGVTLVVGLGGSINATDETLGGIGGLSGTGQILSLGVNGENQIFRVTGGRGGESGSGAAGGQGGNGVSPAFGQNGSSPGGGGGGGVSDPAGYGADGAVSIEFM